jgi:hypothetical protein
MLAVNAVVSEFVPPSGDASGGADSANIQRAIDTIQARCTQWGVMGSVQLAGTYRLSKMLELGAIGAPSAVGLHGIGNAGLFWVGKDVAQPGHRGYMVRVLGGVAGEKVMLSNITLYGWSRIRGLLMANCGGSTVKHVAVHSTLESAVDLIDCWWSSLRNVLIANCTGFSMRTWNANGCHQDSVKVVNAMDGDWPAEDDTQCVDINGAVRVGEAKERAAVLVRGEGSLWSNLCLEGCRMGDKPLLYLPPLGMRHKFHAIRLESNQNTHERVLLDGANHNVFDFVSSSDGDHEENWSECFVRCRGNTVGNRVNRLVGAAGLSKHIMLLDGGQHVGNAVSECWTSRNHIESADWIGRVNSPVVDDVWSDGN